MLPSRFISLLLSVRVLPSADSLNVSFAVTLPLAFEMLSQVLPPTSFHATVPPMPSEHSLPSILNLAVTPNPVVCHSPPGRLSIVNVVRPKSLLARFIFHFPRYGRSAASAAAASTHSTIVSFFMVGIPFLEEIVSLDLGKCKIIQFSVSLRSPDRVEGHSLAGVREQGLLAE